MENQDYATHQFIRSFSVNDFLPDNSSWEELPEEELKIYVQKLKNQLPKVLQEDPLVMCWLYRTYNLVGDANLYQSIYNNEILKALQEYKKLNPNTIENER